MIQSGADRGKSFPKRHFKLIIVCLLAFIMLIIFIGISKNKDDNVLKIADTTFTVSDFNMYVYSGKYNLYGKGNTKLSSKTLNSKYQDNLTVREYLEQRAVNEITIAGIVKRIARENGIKLSTKDYDLLEKEKKDFIKSIGGQSEFNKILRENKTTDEAYDKMAQIDRLYSLIVEKLYSSGKSNDLTNEEKNLAKEEYYNEYLKLDSIVLYKVDLETGKSLSKKELNQKEALANFLYEQALADEDFKTLIDNYSEEDNNNVYYTINQLKKPIREVVNKLEDGEISNIIETDDTFYIIKKNELDDAKLDDYYNQKRNDKLLKDIIKYEENIKIIYYDKYDELEIK